MKPPKPVRLETAPTGRVKVSIYFLNSLYMQTTIDLDRARLSSRTSRNDLNNALAIARMRLKQRLTEGQE